MTGGRYETEIPLSAEQHQRLQAMFEANRNLLDLEYERQVELERRQKEDYIKFQDG